MKIKELQKIVNIAWSPLPQNPIYLAAGTAAQQLDLSANSALEIYSTNFSDPSYDLELKASLPSQYRFQKLIWSSTGFDGAHKNGLIVGGCEGGHVMIYSAAKVLANEEGLIARQDKHSGPVTGLDVNPFQTNLLASCASESEIFIWDLNNTSTHMNPGTKTQPLEDVQNVAWNRQVQHILASVFSSRCVIWDLRKSEQIIKLSDTQSRVRWHAIQWHPDVATQVWLASEDDQAPIVQLWDLRYATAPAKTMQIHQRGVLGMSWCPRDIDLMVSCGKDNRIYCWNPNTDIAEGEILSEVATTATWYSNVQWCPRNPALIASSSLDGNVSIYSLFGGRQQQVQTSNKIADSFPGMDQFAQAPTPQQTAPVVYEDLKRAPKWIKRPCAVSFGFGGKLVHFNSKSKTVNISQVVTEPELVERANTLERSLEDANYVEYCRQRADQMPNQKGRYLWYFIKATFELDPKEEMLNLLGYNKDDIDSKFSKYIKEEQQPENDMDQLTNHISTLTHQPVDNNTVFDGIAAAQKQTETVQKSPTQFKIPCGEHPDSLITEAMLTGNLEAAVELCIESNRTMEALIIASSAGIEFLTKIQNRLLREQNTELSNVILALVTRDWVDLVSRCTVDSWKEVLIAALKHSERKALDICERLGDRLLKECSTSIEYTQTAMLCFVCAGNIDKFVTAWYQLKQLEKENSNYKPNTTELQELAEVVMLMSKSLERQGIALELSGRFADFISEYGGLLASQGAFTAALAYIVALGNSDHPDVLDLRERLHNIVHSKPTTALPTQGFNQLQQQQQQNIYGRQQQQRGSFSQPNTAHNYGNAPISNNLYQNQYATNTWQAPTAVPQMPTPVPAPLFNPTPAVNTAPPGLAKPTSIQNEVPLTQPPRPSSNASSQGGNSSIATGGLMSRSKYVLDPSVAAPMGSYGNTYNPAPPVLPIQTSYNNNAFNANPIPTAHTSLQQQPTLMQPTTYTNTAYGNAYMPGAPPIESQQVAPPPMQNIQRNPTPPPGWNDPPALKTTRATYIINNKEMHAEHAGTRKWQKIIDQEKDKSVCISPCKSLNYNNVYSPNYFSPPFQETFLYQAKKVETTSAASPITHPLFGVDPNLNQNGYMDPNAAYQNNAITGMPPPIPTGNMGGYLNPGANIMQQNNNPMGNRPYTQQTNFAATAVPTQPQTWNTQTQNVGYIEQPAPIQRQPEPPKEKPPLPEEYIYLQTVLEELKNQCLAAASDPRMKRKFVDVVKRLENLYDCLRESRLSPITITALNEIVQFIQVGDYGNALQTHTQIAFGSDFSQCAGFMPGLKVLIQSASELQIYLR